MLVLGLRSENEIRGAIDSLDFHYKAMAHFQEMPDKVLQQLAVLHLRSFDRDGRALNLLADVVPTMTSLNRLHIVGYPPADREASIVKLLQSLTNIHLHTLTISMNPMGHDDILSLSPLIRPPGGLKELTVGEFGMQPDCVELLLKTVLSPSSLQTLILADVKMDGTSLSFSPLKDNVISHRYEFVRLP